MNKPAIVQSVGLPAVLARVPYGVIRPVDAASAYAHPRAQIARLADRGRLHRLAPGFYAVVPEAVSDRGWLPTLEAAGYGIAAAGFGSDNVVLMGLSAARLQGALPRALAVVTVAVPAQRRPLDLTDRPAQVLFVTRDTTRLDAERMPTDLGSALVTGVEQTALDLAHRPELGGAPEEARATAVALLARCDATTLMELAQAQRLGAARRRLFEWAGRPDNA
jgi:predicted transcriptional regulator of viral defense system